MPPAAKQRAPEMFFHLSTPSLFSLSTHPLFLSLSLSLSLSALSLFLSPLARW